MTVLALPWASWVSTILGCAVAGLSAFALDRYFRDTQATLLGPIAWMLGFMLGATATELLLLTLGSLSSPPSLLTIIETSWLQKAAVVLAPVVGLAVSRVPDKRRSTISRSRKIAPPVVDLSPNPSLQRTAPGRSPGRRR